ncbi:hypothetical protein [Methanimicrococcus hongohii]|uniref:hypothetical protein n=1 Tax=Methanimicrococcus hongohii TaxID=3028295 RepID=UPI00292EB289|nr:hypothetical protein [Methanimicrococcus sp. Hf6]
MLLSVRFELLLVSALLIVIRSHSRTCRCYLTVCVSAWSAVFVSAWSQVCVSNWSAVFVSAWGEVSVSAWS